MLTRTRKVTILGPSAKLAARARRELLRRGVQSANLATPARAAALSGGRQEILLAVPAGSAGLRFVVRCLETVLLAEPPPDLAAAIDGIARRQQLAPPVPLIWRRRRPRGPTRALLMEGNVDRSRVARALADPRGPQLWIVESFDCIRIPQKLKRALERRGVRWSVLRPLAVSGALLFGRSDDAVRKLKRRFGRSLPVWRVDQKD